MAGATEQDRPLEEALRRQRDLIEYYKRAAKQSGDDRCKQLFKHLRKHLEDEVGDVASELARHRMERSLGHPLDHS